MAIKTYIINLKQSGRRRAFMETQLKFFPELDAFFFEAIDARLLSDEDLISVYDEKLAIQKMNRSMVRGEIGVALSQLKIMYEISTTREYGLIMEDDLLISPFFSESLLPAVDFINSNEPRIVLFTPVPQYSELNPLEINKHQNRYIYKVWKDACCAACYLINKSASQIILSEYPKVSNVIDNWGYFICSNKIDIRAVIPHVVAFSKYGLTSSTINIADNRDSKIKFLIQPKSFGKRIGLKLKNIYLERKFRVKNSLSGTWLNHLDIIQSNF